VSKAMALRHAIWAALLWLALGAGIALAAPGLAPALSGLRPGLWAGWATAGASSLTAFALLAWSHPRSVQAALGAVAVGFLARMLLLALGLLSALRHGADPLWFTVAFFGAYLPLQGLEIAGVLSRLKGHAVSSPAGIPR
jgi:hypothetical protein